MTNNFTGDRLLFFVAQRSEQFPMQIKHIKETKPFFQHNFLHQTFRQQRFIQLQRSGEMVKKTFFIPHGNDIFPNSLWGQPLDSYDSSRANEKNFLLRLFGRKWRLLYDKNKAMAEGCCTNTGQVYPRRQRLDS